MFINFILIFLNIKLKPKTRHTNIWPIYIYVHTVIRLYCCWDVKATLSCLVFYSFVLSFIRLKVKNHNHLPRVHTHCMFLVESNQHYADNNNIFIFHHFIMTYWSVIHNLRTPLSCHIITYSLFWVSEIDSKSCNYLSNFSIVCKTNCRGKSYDFNTDTKNKQT